MTALQLAQKVRSAKLRYAEVVSGRVPISRRFWRGATRTELNCVAIHLEFPGSSITSSGRKTLEAHDLLQQQELLMTQPSRLSSNVSYNPVYHYPCLCTSCTCCTSMHQKIWHTG
jgi:hypothetical protein